MFVHSNELASYANLLIRKELRFSELVLPYLTASIYIAASGNAHSFPCSRLERLGLAERRSLRFVRLGSQCLRSFLLLCL